MLRGSMSGPCGGRVEGIWDCTCVTEPPFFTQVGTPAGRISNKASFENNVRSTDKSVVIIWDGWDGLKSENSGLNDDITVLVSLETTGLLDGYKGW